MSKRIFPLLLVAGTLAGCMVGPDYRRPELEIPYAYPGSPTQAPGEAVRSEWWKLYDDPVLNELVDATLTRNADMRSAVARAEEAAAALREVSATLLPEVDLNEASRRSRASTLTATPLPPGTPVLTKDQRLTLSTSFELDFWGHLRRASEAARAQMLASRDARDVVALTLSGSTAQLYFSLRALDAQIAVSRETLEARSESLDVVNRRAASGLASDLELNQAQGALADAAVQLKDLQRQRDLVEHQLGSLTGRMDLALPAGDIRRLPQPPLPPAGLPSQLLARRPDVAQSEQSLIAANAQIGVARAAQFPTFSLTASYGGQSEALNEVLKPNARIWSAGIGVLLPIIDAGKYAARTEQAEARQRQALAGYQKAVETAFREVADALTNTQQIGAIEAEQEKRLAAARNSLRLARERYEAGYSPYLEVLDAQRAANDAELQQLRNRQARLSYSVDLMKALGGGWTSRESTAESRE